MLSLKSSSLLSCAILLTVTADVVHSKYVYNPQSHRNIAQHKQVATWDEAKQRCESEGATLASPISAELLQHMKTIITVNNHTTPYFIGFKARDNTEFSSEEGFLLEDVPEAFDMVEQIDPMEGKCLCMDGHSIRVEPCCSRLPFICYTNESSVDITTEIPFTTPVPCGDPEYKLHRTGCYKMYSNDKNWDEANSTCAAEGAHLVAINDRAKAKVVVEFMKASGAYGGWVGLRKAKGSQDWTTVTGERVNELWTYNPLSHYYPQHDGLCGFLYVDGHLEDFPCENYGYFICEIYVPSFKTFVNGTLKHENYSIFYLTISL